MNPIIEKLHTVIPHYCHALEVNDAMELESIIESIIENFTNEGFSAADIKDFCNTLSIYCLNDDNEEEVYNFNINEYIGETI